MKPVIGGASILLGAVLLLILAWLLAGGFSPALAAAPTAAAGTPAATPTILPTPTSVVPPKDSIAPAGPQMTGFVISATLTCGVTVVALIVAAFSLMALLRGGYGPFLRALVYGPQALNANSGASADDDVFPPRATFGSGNEPVGSRRGSRRGDRTGRSGRRAPPRSRRGGRD